MRSEGYTPISNTTASAIDAEFGGPKMWVNGEFQQNLSEAM